MRSRAGVPLVLWLPLLACPWVSSALAAAPPAESSFARPVTTLATALDTDRETDWVAAFPCQESGAAAYYCIEITVSETHSTQTLHVQGVPSGVRIVIRDVDGDQLQDILVMERGDRRPIGIWINDGHGGFQIADPFLFPARIWDDDCLLFPAPPREWFCFASMNGVQGFLLGADRFAEPVLTPSQPLGIADLRAADPVRRYRLSGRSPPAW